MLHSRKTRHQVKKTQTHTNNGREGSLESTGPHSSPKASTKSLVFSWVLKESTLSRDRRESGSLFQRSGKKTEGCLFLNFDLAFRLLNFAYSNLNRSGVELDLVGLSSVFSFTGTLSRRSSGAASHRSHNLVGCQTRFKHDSLLNWQNVSFLEIRCVVLLMSLEVVHKAHTRVKCLL